MSRTSDGGQPLIPPAPAGLAEATFAGGCFWCMEGPFEALDGVVEVYSGYTGGPEANPTYDQVARGRTGHTEAVRVVYDPALVSYEQLLEVYWRQIDPTDPNGQFADRGAQYRPGIFTHDEAQRVAAERSREALDASGRFDRPVRVGIEPVGPFYVAEDYHQDYYRTNSVRYRQYRRGSGREGFLERAWADDPGPAPAASPAAQPGQPAPPAPGEPVNLTDEQWRERLTEEQFRVLREGGTEYAFSGVYNSHYDEGVYHCAGCNAPLFDSSDKYNSGSGWPSYTRAIEEGRVGERVDTSHGMQRVEIHCLSCGGHLGHVFPDGPRPTGMRYCVNSASLRFESR